MQTALITGASSGIGRELAMIFAKNGFNLVLIARNKAALDDLANKITEDFSVKAFVVVKDLGRPEACFEIEELLEKNNIVVDVLVNNAGFGRCEYFVNIPLDVMSEMIAVNISAVSTLTRLLLPGMIQRKHGKIVNIASIVASFPTPFMATYGATKSYILSFSKALAEELRGTGVYVTAVCPGGTETLFSERANATINKRLEKFPQMSAKDVAHIAFKGIIANKQVVITGISNKITVAILPVILKLFGLRLTRYFMDGVANKKLTNNQS